MSPLGAHSFFQQFHKGLPVSDSWLRLDQNSKREVVYYSARPRLKASNLADSKPSMPNSRKIRELVKSIEGDFRTSLNVIGDPELAFRKLGRRFACVLKMKVASQKKPYREATVYADAATLAVLSVQELEYHSIGKGKVFNPHPLAHFNATSLPLDGEIPEILYREVDVQGLDGTGYLDGAYVTTSATANRIKRTALDFRVTRTAKGFGEVMAYSHIDAVYRYIESLGFRNLRSAPVQVNARSGETSSRYLPIQDLILLGGDNVPDAEDGEIIVHEFAHALHSSICPPLGTDNVSVNIAEGFADYLAGSFFAEFKSEAMRPLIGAWDTYNHTTVTNPPYLRRLDRTTTFSDVKDSLLGRSDNVTEFWGSTLFDIYKAFGRERADILIIGSLFVLKKDSNKVSFLSVSKAIVKANQLGYDDSDRAKLIQIFKDRGIFAP